MRLPENRSEGLGYSLHTRARRAGYAVQLLLERRVWMYLIGDAFFLFFGFLGAIDSSTGHDLIEKIYGRVVLMPALVLGLPAMAGVVALERRAGSLDLALAAPSTERYFLRRIWPISLFLATQGTVAMVLAADGWVMARGVCQSVTWIALLTALTLFWASRLKTSGAVVVASLVTVAVFWPWIFFSPLADSVFGTAPKFLGMPLPVISWGWKTLIATLAALIFYLYARQRLRRPEVMLT